MDNQTRPDIIKIRNNLDHLGIFTNCIQAKIGYLIVYANNTIYHNWTFVGYYTVTSKIGFNRIDRTFSDLILFNW